MIPVTKPFSPPIEEYQKFLEGIWERNWFTNNGPLVNQFELNLKTYLEVPHLLYVSNGTIALQLAIKALGITKKIITTPFSYVATTSSIVWEGCTPVFVDINPKTLNLDPSKIEEAIDEDTEAILATHCFGNPCDIDAIQSIAERFNLKVIYDAAHCFGTTYKGKSIFSYGDISTTSFHATKLFHSIEGGAVFTNNPDIVKKISFMRNFGHNGPEEFEGIGINAKNSEFHAAMGLVNLKYIDQILMNRKYLAFKYDEYLKGSDLSYPQVSKISQANYSYYPIIFSSEKILLEVKKGLEACEVFPRRYFYPSLSKLDYVSGMTPISDSVSRRILCLPLYYGLRDEEIRLVTRKILRILKYS